MYNAEFWKSTLKADAVPAYESLYQAFKNGEKTAAFPRFSSCSYMDVYMRVIFDHPELFYYGSTFEYRESQTMVEMALTYSFPFAKYKQLLLVAQMTLEREFGHLKSSKDNYEKALFVHDWLSKHVTYDLESEDPFNALGPLLRGRGVCQGISLAAKWILDYLDTLSIVCFGKGDNGEKNEDHAWNIVYMKGLPYHVDYTFDLDGTHYYFGLDDETIRLDHTFERIPGVYCRSKKENYYVKEGLLFHDVPSANAALAERFAKGEKSVEIRLDDGSDEERSDLLLENTFEGSVEIRYDLKKQLYLFKRK